MKVSIISHHILDYCVGCKCNMVRCGTCHNNCCNGGYGQVEDKDCSDCPSAYDLQTLYWKAEDSTRIWTISYFIKGQKK